MMLLPTSRVRVYVYRDACDMRKSFSGLVGLVRAEVAQDPLSGHLFLFMNRR
jgi:transposase